MEIGAFAVQPHGNDPHRLAGNGALNHFCDIASSVPSFFDCAIASFTLASSRGSFLFMPTKHGEFLMMNFGSGRRGGFFARIAAATMLPAAISSTWPERKAWMVALLSSKRLIVAFGAICVNAISSSAPRVAPTVLPVRSAGLAHLVAEGTNTP